MSTLVAVRVPDSLIAKIDERGKRSSVIIEALELLFTEAPGAVMVRPKPKSAEIVVVSAMPRRIRHDVKACRIYGCLMCKGAKNAS